MTQTLDRWWTALEVALVVGLTAALTVSLTAWVALKGLSSRTTDTFIAGLVFRALVGSITLGAVAFRITRRRALALMAALVGAGLSWVWREVGVEWATNLLGWSQDGSTLTLVGGLRGLGTRLTLWLAMVGGSLATASGRHVSIDVASRALGESLRNAMQRLGGIVAATVCLISAWGFFDFTAIDAFGAPQSAGVTTKLSAVVTGLAHHAQVAKRQVRLDVVVLPRVVAGARWDQTLTNREWLEAGEPDSGETLATRVPLVSVPGESVRGLLTKSFNLIIPFGLVMMGLRFLLWVLRGAPSEAAHGEAEVAT